MDDNMNKCVSFLVFNTIRILSGHKGPHLSLWWAQLPDSDLMRPA